MRVFFTGFVFSCAVGQVAWKKNPMTTMPIVYGRVVRVLRAAFEADYHSKDEDETTTACDGDSPASDSESGLLLDCSVDSCPSGTYCRRSAGDIEGRKSTARCCPRGICRQTWAFVTTYSPNHNVYKIILHRMNG